MSNQQAVSDIAEINGAQLYYEVKGSGQPLVLLHAGIADSRMWDQQFDSFAQNYRVVRFDYRGFGRSNMPSGTFSNPEDVRALLDFLQIQQAHVLGISFGGLIALDFTLTYPDYVKALILGAPSISGAKPSERIKQFWEAEDEAIDKGDLEAATELNLQLWVDGPHRTPKQVNPVVRERIGEMQLNIFKIPVPEDDEIEEVDLDPPASERLAEIKAPTLIIIGELDLEEKISQVDQLVSDLATAKKAVITNAAHMMNMEKPDEFNRLVLDFLRGL